METKSIEIKVVDNAGWKINLIGFFVVLVSKIPSFTRNRKDMVFIIDVNVKVNR